MNPQLKPITKKNLIEKLTEDLEFGGYKVISDYDESLSYNENAYAVLKLSKTQKDSEDIRSGDLWINKGPKDAMHDYRWFYFTTGEDEISDLIDVIGDFVVQRNIALHLPIKENIADYYK